MEKYQSPIPLPDEHMRMVGIIAAHWEWIELILERSIAEIMEQQHHTVGLLTANISFGSKCDLILVYARVFEKDQPQVWKEFTTAIEALGGAYMKRNTYVHAKWKRDRSTLEWGITTVRTRGGKLTASDNPVSVNELVDAAQSIFDAGERFTALVQRFGILVQSQGKSSSRPPEQNQPGA
jgi:hypothetical protein